MCDSPGKHRIDEDTEELGNRSSSPSKLSVAEKLTKAAVMGRRASIDIRNALTLNALKAVADSHPVFTDKTWNNTLSKNVEMSTIPEVAVKKTILKVDPNNISVAKKITKVRTADMKASEAIRHSKEILERESEIKRKKDEHYVPSESILKTTKARILDSQEIESRKAKIKPEDDIWWENRNPASTVPKNKKDNVESKLFVPTLSYLKSQREKHTSVPDKGENTLKENEKEVHIHQIAPISDENRLLKTTKAVNAQTWTTNETDSAPKTYSNITPIDEENRLLKMTKTVLNSSWNHESPAKEVPELRMYTKDSPFNGVKSKLSAETTAMLHNKWKGENDAIQSESTENDAVRGTHGVSGVSEHLATPTTSNKMGMRPKYQKEADQDSPAGWNDQQAAKVDILSLEDLFPTKKSKDAAVPKVKEVSDRLLNPTAALSHGMRPKYQKQSSPDPDGKWNDFHNIKTEIPDMNASVTAVVKTPFKVREASERLLVPTAAGRSAMKPKFVNEESNRSPIRGRPESPSKADRGRSVSPCKRQKALPQDSHLLLHTQSFDTAIGELQIKNASAATEEKRSLLLRSQKALPEGSHLLTHTQLVTGRLEELHNAHTPEVKKSIRPLPQDSHLLTPTVTVLTSIDQLAHKHDVPEPPKTRLARDIPSLPEDSHLLSPTEGLIHSLNTLQGKIINSHELILHGVEQENYGTDELRQKLEDKMSELNKQAHSTKTILVAKASQKQNSSSPLAIKGSKISSMRMSGKGSFAPPPHAEPPLAAAVPPPVPETSRRSDPTPSPASDRRPTGDGPKTPRQTAGPEKRLSATPVAATDSSQSPQSVAQRESKLQHPSRRASRLVDSPARLDTATDEPPPPPIQALRPPPPPARTKSSAAASLFGSIGEDLAAEAEAQEGEQRAPPAAAAAAEVEQLISKIEDVLLVSQNCDFEAVSAKLAIHISQKISAPPDPEPLEQSVAPSDQASGSGQSFAVEAAAPVEVTVTAEPHLNGNGVPQTSAIAVDTNMHGGVGPEGDAANTPEVQKIIQTPPKNGKSSVQSPIAKPLSHPQNKSSSSASKTLLKTKSVAK